MPSMVMSTRLGEKMVFCKTKLLKRRIDSQDRYRIFMDDDKELMRVAFHLKIVMQGQSVSLQVRSKRHEEEDDNGDSDEGSEAEDSDEESNTNDETMSIPVKEASIL